MEERILLADDSEIVLEMIGSQLSAEGFQVTTCLSGREAVEHANGRTSFDLVILDVMMPDMTGFEATRAIRRNANCASTPILLLTSLDGTSDKVAGLESGADDFLTKTVSDAELVARVRSLVVMGKLRTKQSTTRATAANLLAARPAATPVTSSGSKLYVVHELPEIRAELLALCQEDAQLGREMVDVAAELAHLGRAAPDVVLISYARAFESTQPLAEMLQEWESPPAIIIADAQPSTERRIAAYQGGAEDYIALSTPRQEIAARVMAALRRRRRFLSLESARDQALEVAITDQLTGLYNRGYFEEVLRSECKRSSRYGQSAAVMLLDIDHFKQVNDTYGHQAGDQVLREVGRRVTAALRGSDLAARYGGEEFIFLLPHTNKATAVAAANRVRQALGETPFHVGSFEIRVTASLGVALTPVDAEEAKALIDLADAALYVAKRSGRNQVVLSDAARAGAQVAEACPLCEAMALLADLLAEDLDSPLTAVRAAAHLLGTSSADGESTNAVLQGLRESSGAIVDQLGQVRALLATVVEEHSCHPRSKGSARLSDDASPPHAS